MTFVKRILYGAGQLGMMALTRYLFGWLVAFAAAEGPGGHVLFSAGAVGALFLAFRVFDGVTDPLAGILSDRWVRRGHQRRHLLWLSFALPPLGLVLTFAPDHAMAAGLRWTLLASGMFVFFVGYTFYAIPYWSLVDDYSRGDEEERRILSTTLGAGLMVATAIGFVASPGLVRSLGYRGASLVFAVPAAAMMLLPWFAAPRDLRPVEPQRSPDAGLAASLKTALGHRRFLALLVLFSGSQMSFTIMTAAAPFIATRLLGGTVSDVAWLLGPLLVTSVLGFPAVPRLSRRWGWERGLVRASLALALVYSLSGGLGHALLGTPLHTAMIIFALGGPMTALLLGLENEAITACARERGDAGLVSTYFGVFNFVVKALNGLALALAGGLADLSRGSLGTTAIRMMSFTAGGCLVVGVISYYLLRSGYEASPAAETFTTPRGEPGGTVRRDEGVERESRTS